MENKVNEISGNRIKRHRNLKLGAATEAKKI